MQCSWAPSSPTSSSSGFSFSSSCQMQGGGNRVMAFGRSKAKTGHPPISPGDLQGRGRIDEAGRGVAGDQEFLGRPQKFRRWGPRSPRGCCSSGRPGTARPARPALAGEAGVPSSPSPARLREMFVGVGASRVRDCSSRPRRTPRLMSVLSTSLDAVGRHRGAGLAAGTTSGADPEPAAGEMDGFDPRRASSSSPHNRPDILDPALLRPGRFDRQNLRGPARHQGPPGHPPGATPRQAAGEQAEPGSAGPFHTGLQRGPTWPTPSTRRRSSPPGGARSHSPRRNWRGQWTGHGPVPSGAAG